MAYVVAPEKSGCADIRQLHSIKWLEIPAVALMYGNSVVDPELNYSSKSLSVVVGPKGTYAFLIVIYSYVS